MTCLEIKDFLQENFVAAGFDLTPEIKQHFDDCEGCRSYYAEMVSLGDALEPMTDIAMTPEESVHFDIGLHLAIEKFASSQPSYVSEGRIFSIARMALAAAAVLIMMVVSSETNFLSSPDILRSAEELQLTQLDNIDMESLLINGNSDLIPSFLEGESAAYLTGQVQPGQADDIFEEISDDELNWLLDNLRVGI